MIIRHAEKPNGTSRGVAEDGTECKHDLTVRGWQRAGALAYFFSSSSVPTPQFLFASAPTGDAAETNGIRSRSKRSVDTLLPLSRRLNLQIDISFTKGKERELAQTAQRCPGVVLIAWQHESINSIVRALPWSHAALPANWPEERFDVIYILDFDATAAEYRFTQRSQCLLDRDLDAPIR